MPVRPVTEYLDQHNIPYHSYNHPPAMTAQEVAKSTHIPGQYMAKTVVVKADDNMMLVVLPANAYIDTELLRERIGCKKLALASETEFSDQFPLCETGGMPPFGTLYHMDVFMDQTLVEDDWIAFNAGTHTEVIKMDTNDFIQLVNPAICSFISVH